MKIKKVLLLFICVFVLGGCDGFGSFFVNNFVNENADGSEKEPIEIAFVKFESSVSYNFSLAIGSDAGTTISLKEVDISSNKNSFVVSKATLSDHKISYVLNDKGKMRYINAVDGQTNEIDKKSVPNDFKADYLLNEIIDIKTIKKELNHYVLDKTNNEYIYEGTNSKLKNSKITIDDKNNLRSIRRNIILKGVEDEILFINNVKFLSYKDLNFDIR